MSAGLMFPFFFPFLSKKLSRRCVFYIVHLSRMEKLNPSQSWPFVMKINQDLIIAGCDVIKLPSPKQFQLRKLLRYIFQKSFAQQNWLMENPSYKPFASKKDLHKLRFKIGS